MILFLLLSHFWALVVATLIVGMQAQTVLQSMYLEGIQGQLQAQENKKTKK
jgi:hypothetical protein